jgi:hypothetical protein
MRYAIVAIVVFACLFAPSPSLEGVDVCCTHDCCTGTYLSRPVQRLAARLKSALTAGLAAMLVQVTGWALMHPTSPDSAEPLAGALSLRI